MVEGLHDLLGSCMELEAQATELGGRTTADQLLAIRRSLVVALQPLEDLFGTATHFPEIPRGESAHRADELVETSLHA